MKLFKIIFLLLILSSCSSNNEVVTKKPEPGLFSKDASKGITIDDFLNRDGQSEKFYVNSFLWRASLDVLSFAPFQSTDAFGGIIVTEWFKKNNQQIKLTALIKSRDLRSEGINIKAYIKNKKNEISEDIVLSRKIEDLILTKARALRIQNKLK
ncbi:MAG: DUF3576 domain-containing protein [Candidatus Puniceispirillales bacterium]|tara:strand:- start:944 stop:1405 length:462 start_codon:yes stop_codon:yes gene_type:complete